MKYIHSLKEFNQIFEKINKFCKSKYKKENLEKTFYQTFHHNLTEREDFSNSELSKINYFRNKNGLKPIEMKEFIDMVYKFILSKTEFFDESKIKKVYEFYKKTFYDNPKGIFNLIDENPALWIGNIDEELKDTFPELKSEAMEINIIYPRINQNIFNEFYYKEILGLKKKPGFFDTKPPKINIEKLISCDNVFVNSEIIPDTYFKQERDRIFMMIHHIPVTEETYKKLNELNQEYINHYGKQSKESFSTEGFFKYLFKNALNTHDTFINVKKDKVYRCPLCKRSSYSSPKLLENHVLREHENEIPPSMPVAQFIFNIRNKKTHGNCVICKRPTSWNPEINKYHRFCSEECKNKYVKEAKERLLRVHGTDNLAKDPEHQKKMLENRKITKKYVYDDGSTITCVGSYEYDFIKYNDEVLNIGSGSIENCGILFHYEFENKERVYIPDFYIPSLNLIIEIKDKGDNNHPNIKIHMKNMDVEKFKAVVESNKYNFIVVAGKEYEEYTEMIDYLKSRDVNEKDNNKLLIQIPKEVYKNFINSSETMELNKDIFISINDLNENSVKDVNRIRNQEIVLPFYGEKYLNTDKELMNEYNRLKNVNNKSYSKFYFVKLKNGTVIGSFSLDNIDLTSKTAYLNYFIDKKYQGKGIGTKIVKYILENNNLSLKTIYAHVHINNQGSLQILQKNGFLINKQMVNKEGDEIYLLEKKIN